MHLHRRMLLSSSAARSQLFAALAMAILAAPPVRAIGPGAGSVPIMVVRDVLGAEANWQDYTPSYRPLLVEFEEAGGSSVIFGATVAPNGFLPLTEVDSPNRRVFWRSGVSEFEFVTRTLPPGDSFPAGANVCRVRSGSGRDGSYGLIVHEIFHSYQEERFKLPRLKRAAAISGSFDDAESLASLSMEHHLLSQALLDTGRSLELVRDYISLRRDRRTRFRDAVALEDAMETIEGTARYTEMMGYAERYSRATVIAGLVRQLAAYLSDDARSIRSRYYASGASMAFLLDQLDARWQEDAESGTPLFELLERAVPLAPADGRRLAEAARARLRGAELRASAAATLDLEAAFRRQVLREFDSAEARAAVELPPATERYEIGGAGRPLAHLSTGESIEYRDFLAIRAEKYALRFEDRLMKGPWKVSGQPQEGFVEFALPPDARWVADGKAVGSQDGQVAFDNLQLDGRGVHLSFRTAGTLVRKKRVFYVRFGASR